MAELSEHIKDDYSIVHVVPGVLIFKGEKVDLRTISKAKADELVNQGFRYLKKKRKRRKASDSDS